MTHCTEILSLCKAALKGSGFDSVSSHYLPDGIRMLINDKGQIYELVIKPLSRTGEPMLQKESVYDA